jgi:effector-binding domain-containing protein
MDYQVEARRVEPQITAVVCFTATQKQLSTLIPQACGEVWNFIRSAGIPQPGRHVALYLDGVMNIECGAEVGQPFRGNGRVVCSQTPAGLVATTAHFGPYHLLGNAYDAIDKWCVANGHAKAGPSWEVYGHWTDDPTQLRTDVFWLLKDASSSSANPTPP